MKNQLISFLLTMLLCMTGATAFAHYIEVKNDDGVTIYYDLNGNTELAVSYRGSSYLKYSDEYSGVVVIPSSVTYNGSTYSVTRIGDYAFRGCSGLTSVTIPNSVTSIGDRTFSGCSGLTSVTIGYSVTSIGNSTFEGCSGLTSVTIPNSVTSIGSYAFSGCSSLTSVTIPNSVVSIGNYAFEECSGLTFVTIGNSVTSIGERTFYGCSGLTSVAIPGSVTSIGTEAFYSCSSLTSVTIPNSVTSIGREAFSFCSGLTSVHISDIAAWCKIAFSGNYSNPLYYAHNLYLGEKEITDLEIPNSVTSIGYYTFYGCSGLTSVTIPNSVTSIGYSAFSGCSGLTSVTIPSSLTSIGQSAFSGCSKLNSINILDLSAWCNHSFGPQISSSYHLLLNGTEIKNLKVPNDLTAIGKSVFKGCSYLTSITVPSSVTIIDESAFENCSLVESLSLSNGLVYIRKAAFKGCNSLKELKIPASVEFIYQEAFANCTGLESVKALPETPPFLYANSFSNYDIPLYTNEIAIAAYQAHETWSKFTQFLTLDGQEVEVPQCATPTIDYANWKLTFDCATEGAEIVSEVTCNDSKKGNEKTVNLTPTYTITAYAKAEGYRDSDVVTATISWKDGRPVIIRGFNNASLEEGEAICDVNNDGKVDVADIATIISKIAGK